MSEKPPWRKAIEDYERSIGAPMEEFIKSDEFADIAAQAAKQQAKMQRELGESTTQWLHSMNLPAASDIAELRAEVQALREEVRALTDAVAPKPRPKTTTKARPKTTTKARPKTTTKAKPKAKPKPRAKRKPKTG